MIASKSGGVITLVLLGGAAALAYVVRDHLHTPYDADFDQLGKKYNIPSNFLRAIGRHESGFNPAALDPKTGTYPNGSVDVGIMQVNTKEGTHFGYTHADLLVPSKCIECACKYLVAVQKELGSKASIYTWAASYNTGAAHVGSDRGAAYSGAVVYHWQLYEIGRVLA